MDDRKNIPKVVHYIWFGKTEKNDLIKKCIENTREVLNDWKIIEWNEDTFDIDKCDYAKEAYDHKKYAFAADYVRFDILYNKGGVYLDTDVELLKPIPDAFLLEEGFTGLESNMKIAPGLIFAVEPHNPIVKEILEVYENEKYILDNGTTNKRTVVDIVTDVFSKHGFKRDGSEQIINGFHIYPSEYFCAYDFVSREFDITSNTISIHHYTATWTGKSSRFKVGFQNILKKIMGINNYRKLLKIKRKIFGVHGE